ncbi:hypothetical protein CTZ27_31995 [Streptomyces griseocarneus]|nr:hypothetical protein CTZ27_31995 [Streptomyces griseocarneus]
MTDLKPSDDGCHKPLDEPFWEENFFFLAWDARTSSGFTLHLMSGPHRGCMEAKGWACVDGHTAASSALTTGAGEVLATRGLTTEIVRPFEKWRMRYEGMGMAYPAEFTCVPLREGPVPFGFDIEYTARHVPLPWSPQDLDVFPRLTHGRYEQGGGWKGRVWVGDRDVESTTGLIVRDHSWGPRTITYGEGWWCPMSFGEELFVSGQSAISYDRWTGWMAVVDGDTVTRLDDPMFRCDKPLTYRNYTSATVRPAPTSPIADDFQFTGHITIPSMYDALYPAAYIIEDTLSTVRWGDRTGYGNIDYHMASTHPHYDVAVRNVRGW